MAIGQLEKHYSVEVLDGNIVLTLSPQRAKWVAAALGTTGAEPHQLRRELVRSLTRAASLNGSLWAEYQAQVTEDLERAEA
jgi:hypothetical protein